jgi:YidC/Oxa1 family membrane protein insertase
LAARRIGAPIAFAAASRPLLFSPRQARNASTQTATPFEAAPAPEASSLADLAGTPVSLTGSDLLDIPEQIGFLKTLGLDYGWGPTSLMQYLLESVYVYTGLPWWASIGVVAVAVRLALLKPTFNATQNSQIQQDLRKDPKYVAATDEMKSMMISGNHLAGAEARARVSMMHRAAGFSIWKSAVPLLQIPIGFGMFRLIKGMAALPVPSFESGGVLWFTDLAAADPLFILPIAASIVMMAGMRVCSPAP